jgi:hypothetical protein
VKKVVAVVAVVVILVGRVVIIPDVQKVEQEEVGDYRIVLDQIVQLLMGVVKIQVMPLIPIDLQELE